MGTVVSKTKQQSAPPVKDVGRSRHSAAAVVLAENPTTGWRSHRCEPVVRACVGDSGAGTTDDLATDITKGGGRVRIACVLAGVLGGVLGQVLGAVLIFVNAIRFSDYRTIPSGSALFIFSWFGFFAALTALRRPRTSVPIHLGAIIGLTVVALVARIWSLGVPVALLALCGGYALSAARREAQSEAS